jgi:methionyl-tRNA synthetase
VLSCLRTALYPFLPFSSERLHRILGYDLPLFGEQKIVTYQESERPHQALIYDPAPASGAWEPSQLKPGQAMRQPEPLYRKLDESIVEEERARLGQPTA